MTRYEELDAEKRALQRKRQRFVDEGKSTRLIDMAISRTQRKMNALIGPAPRIEEAPQEHEAR